MLCSDEMLGFGSGTKHLTNQELNGRLHPLNSELPYVFRGFDEWGDCTYWDPCPECSRLPENS